MERSELLDNFKIGDIITGLSIDGCSMLGEWVILGQRESPGFFPTTELLSLNNPSHRLEVFSDNRAFKVKKRTLPLSIQLLVVISLMET